MQRAALFSADRLWRTAAQWGTTQCEFLAKGGSELRAEDFDGAFHFFVQESGYAHLEGEARNATESLVEVENFVGGQSRSLPISVKVWA